MAGKRPVALVTGGAHRVGAAVVRRLAREGFVVAITYRTSAEAAERLVAEVDGVAIQADLTDLPAAADRIVAEMSRRFDRLDLLLNNASMYEPGSDLALARSMMSLHAEAPALLARGLAPLLRAARGSVINMVDILAERPWPKYAAYCASKAALANLTVSLARELAPDVTVNGIAPGVVEWPADLPQSEREAYLKRVPLGRAGSPEDVASLVRFLATEGKYITGQIIRLDGGRSIV